MTCAVDRALQRVAQGPVGANVHDFAWARLKARGFVEVIDYRPGRLRQTFVITPRGRAALQKKLAS